MALTGNGSTDYSQATTAISLVNTYTFHAWYRNASVPVNAAPVKHPFGLANADFDFNFCWNHTSASLWKSFIHREAGGAYQSAQFTTTPSANTWYSVAATYDATNLKCWLDGVNEATTAAAIANISGTALPTALAHDAAGGYDDGTIAEVAMWNVALGAADITALARRASPLLVRPDRLLFYWPLIRNGRQVVGGATTGVGLSVFVHPPMIYPPGDQLMRYAAVADYAPVSASFSTALTATSEMVEPPGFSTPLTITTAFALSDVFVRLAESTNVRSRFTCNSGNLANGRHREVY